MSPFVRLTVSRKVVIGLDGFHDGLLNYTPTIRRIYETGHGTTLESTTPPITAPAWATFQTGMDVESHRILDFVTYDESFEASMLDGRALDEVTVYELLSSCGVSCYVQNLPFALPARIEGDVMPSWLDDDEVDPHPSDLCSTYEVDRPTYPSFRPDDSKAQQLNRIDDSFRRNSQTFLSVLETGDHGFLFFLVSATDWLQHKSLMHLEHEPDSTIAAEARAILVAVDSFVATVSDSLEADDDLILLSDHGFRIYDRQFSINDWLQRKGYLKTSTDGTHFESRTERDEMTINTGTLVRRIAHLPVMFPVAKRVNNALRRMADVSFTTESKIDVKASLAYCVSKDTPAIEVVANGQDSERIASEIVSKADTIDGLAAEILPAEDIGANPVVLLHSDTIRFVRGPTGDVWRDETIPFHDSQGILAGKGPSFEGQPADPTLADLAPTLLLLFDQPIPDTMDGSPLTSWIGHEGDFEMIPESEHVTSFKTAGEDDSEAVMGRLEDLGYL